MLNAKMVHVIFAIHYFQDKICEVIGTAPESYAECEPSIVENASSGAGCYSNNQNDDTTELNTIIDESYRRILRSTAV